LRALALAVQASLPLLLTVELRRNAADALMMESALEAGAPADRVRADTANPHDSDHHCTCPICQILAECQAFAVRSESICDGWIRSEYRTTALRKIPMCR